MLAARPDGHTDGRCRHASVMALRLDAQSRAHGRGVFPYQKPARSLATGGGLVLGHSGGCGSGQQYAGLAVGGRVRGRCGALFPYFNPALQGQRFGPDGHYVRQWVPEIAALPNKYLHRPWTAPSEVLKTAHIELGRHYPHPLVDLKDSRRRALNAFAEIKNDKT